jgi:hypothetical protein
MNVDFTQIEILLVTVLLPPLLIFAAKWATRELGHMLEPWIGHQEALVVQKRLNEILDHGVGKAVAELLPIIQAHGLTLNVQSALVAIVVQYAVDHGGEFVQDLGGLEQAGLTRLDEKARARLVAHPAVQAAMTTPVVNDNPPLDLHPATSAAA